MLPFPVGRELTGKGDLTVEVTDPTGSPIETQMLKSPSGDQHVSFLPTKLGQHKVALKVAGFQVPGKCTWFCALS